MKKYYVIYNLKLKEYVKPMAHSCGYTTEDIGGAGTWLTEEDAEKYLATIIMRGDRMTIFPIYLKH